MASVSAQTGSRASAAQVAAAIERELRAARVPGASFAVVSGSESLSGQYGLADAAHDVTMTPATLMQVGSLNKLMTALALGATLQQRNISYDAPVGKHVTGLSPRLAQVTFHQLLSHTSGLRDHPGENGTTDEGALGERVRAITDGDFLLPAGTVFSYSNLGYAVAGFALEQLRQKPFADALREAILEPLLMPRTTMRLSALHEQPYARGHRLDGSAAVAMAEVDNDTSIWPAGYLWTTGEEMLGVLGALVAGGDNARGLSDALLRRVTTAHTPMPNVFVGGHYGYGLMLASDRGVRIYEHGGTQRGFSSILRVAPDRQLGIVILTNLDNAPLRRIAQSVIADALSLPVERPAPRDETTIDPDAIKPFVGIYRNRSTVEIAVRDGRALLIVDGGPPMVVSRIGANRYLARPRPEIAGPEFVLQPATAKGPAYLHFALWAHVK